MHKLYIKAEQLISFFGKNHKKIEELPFRTIIFAHEILNEYYTSKQLKNKTWEYRLTIKGLWLIHYHKNNYLLKKQKVGSHLLKK